jgi:hypothetical protein
MGRRIEDTNLLVSNDPNTLSLKASKVRWRIASPNEM